MKIAWMKVAVSSALIIANLRVGAAQTGTNQRDYAEAADFKQPLVKEDLAEIRGGFVTDSGLTISLWIQRDIWIDGQLVASTVAGAVPTALADIDSVHAVDRISTMTAIQNQFDNQKIQVYTTINSTVTATALMQSLNIQASLHDITSISLHH